MTTTTTGPELRFMTLDVYRVAREIAVRVARLEVKDAELTTQAGRASKSIVLNLAEGLPSKSAGLRRRYFTTALGSANEVAAAIDLAIAIGAAREADGKAILTLCNRVGAMLNRMR